MKEKRRTSKYKMRACILTLAKVFLALFCSIGLMYSVQAEDLPEAKGPFFYKADKGGKSLYLLGTLHVDILDQLQCRSPIMSFLKDSDLLFTETSQEKRDQAVGEYFADVSKSAGDGLFNSLDENDKRFLVDIYKKITQKSHSDEYIANLQQGNSWTIANLIATSCVSPETRQLISTITEGKKMDWEIQKIADGQFIPQAFLDDTDDLKEIVSIGLVPFRDHFFTEEDIISLISDYDRLCSINGDNYYQSYYNFFTMFQNLYLTGEVNEGNVEYMFQWTYQTSELYYFFFNDKPIPEDKSFKALKDKLLKNRNQKWIEKIKQSHEENDSVFTAAGILHLIGLDNILDMLREDDFSIQRMDAGCSFNSDL